MSEKLTVRVGETVTIDKKVGAIVKIRVIDGARFVDSFSGKPEDVVITVQTKDGVSNLWGKEIKSHLILGLVKGEEHTIEEKIKPVSPNELYRED